MNVVITKCKNCGHPVKRLFWFWWRHCYIVDLYSYHLTLMCNEASDCGCKMPQG